MPYFKDDDPTPCIQETTTRTSAVEAGRKFHYAKLLRKKSTQKKGMLSKLSDLPFAKKGNLKSLKKLYKKHFFSLDWKKKFARRWTNKYRYRPIRGLALLAIYQYFTFEKNRNCKKCYFLSTNAIFLSILTYISSALYLAGTWLKFTLFKISPIRVPDISVDYKRIKIWSEYSQNQCIQAFFCTCIYVCIRLLCFQKK